MFLKTLVILCVVILCHGESRHMKLNKLLPNVKIGGLLGGLLGGPKHKHREIRESPPTIIVEEYEFGGNTRPNYYNQPSKPNYYNQPSKPNFYNQPSSNQNYYQPSNQNYYSPGNEYYEVSVVDYNPRPSPPHRGPPPPNHGRPPPHHHHHHHGPPRPNNNPWNQPGVIPDKFDGTIIIVEETDQPTQNNVPNNPTPMTPWIKPTLPNYPNMQTSRPPPPDYPNIPTAKPTPPNYPSIPTTKPTPADPGYNKPDTWNIDDFISGLPDIDSGNTPEAQTNKPITRSPSYEDDNLDPVVINKPTSRPNVFTTPPGWTPPKLDVDIDVRFGGGNLPVDVATSTVRAAMDPDRVIFSDKR